MEIGEGRVNCRPSQFFAAWRSCPPPICFLTVPHRPGGIEKYRQTYRETTHLSSFCSTICEILHLFLSPKTFSISQKFNISTISLSFLFHFSSSSRKRPSAVWQLSSRKSGGSGIFYETMNRSFFLNKN